MKDSLFKKVLAGEKVSKSLKKAKDLKPGEFIQSGRIRDEIKSVDVNGAIVSVMCKNYHYTLRADEDVEVFDTNKSVLTRSDLEKINKTIFKSILKGENNPFAICTASVGRDDKDKYEACVLHLTEKSEDFDLRNEVKRRIRMGFSEDDIYYDLVNRVPDEDFLRKIIEEESKKYSKDIDLNKYSFDREWDEFLHDNYEQYNSMELVRLLSSEFGISLDEADKYVKEFLNRFTTKDVGIEYAGPEPKSGLAAQDLERDTSSSTEKSIKKEETEYEVDPTTSNINNMEPAKKNEKFIVGGEIDYHGRSGKVLRVSGGYVDVKFYDTDKEESIDEDDLRDQNDMEKQTDGEEYSRHQMQATVIGRANSGERDVIEEFLVTAFNVIDARQKAADKYLSKHPHFKISSVSVNEKLGKSQLHKSRSSDEIKIDIEENNSKQRRVDPYDKYEKIKLRNELDSLQAELSDAIQAEEKTKKSNTDIAVGFLKTHIKTSFNKVWKSLSDSVKEKLVDEAIDKMPDTSQWRRWVENFLRNKGCTPSEIKEIIDDIEDSPLFDY